MDNKEVEQALLAQEMRYLKEKLDTFHNDFSDFEKSLPDQFVSKAEFDPIKKVVYGVVGLVLTTVAAAVITLILK